MKKITSKNFAKKIAKYGALSAAIAGVSDASGQIVYTDIVDVGGAGAFYQIDLNNDATPDFVVAHINSAIPSSTGFYNILACAPSNSSLGSPSNAILGNSGSFIYPFALSNGAVISSGLTSWNANGFQTMNYNSCVYGGDFWCANLGDKYLGLKFDIGGLKHYGWARIEVGATSSNWLIKDYAYNSTADGPINAGQTVLGIEDNMFSKIRVVALSKSIALYNLPTESRYNVFNMTGQQVLNGTTNNRDYVIEAPTLASGVYILELADNKSNGVIRKKVVLQ